MRTYRIPASKAPYHEREPDFTQSNHRPKGTHTMRDAKETFMQVIEDFVADDEGAEPTDADGINQALADRFSRYGLVLDGDEGVQNFAAQLVATNLLVGIQHMSADDPTGKPDPIALVAHVGVAVFQQGLDIGLALGEQGPTPLDEDVTPDEA